MCIRSYLRERRVPFEALLHRPASSATQRARSLHVAGSRVAKGVLLRASGGFVLAVVPATHRIDLQRLAEVLRVEALRLATEDEVGAVFSDCERGALPPFGRPYGLATVVDSALAAGPEVVLEGNTRHEGFRLRFRDYESLEAPRLARFSRPIDPRRRRPSRRAG
jgi:Ala-tRNA(Pro) deacylase